jgi:hypothetical protein
MPPDPFGKLADRKPFIPGFSLIFIMKSRTTFVSLRSLILSLDQPRRIYFLYRQAAAGGAPGAMLRFEWLKQNSDPLQLQKLERLFDPEKRPQ